MVFGYSYLGCSTQDLCRMHGNVLQIDWAAFGSLNRTTKDEGQGQSFLTALAASGAINTIPSNKLCKVALLISNRIFYTSCLKCCFPIGDAKQQFPGSVFYTYTVRRVLLSTCLISATGFRVNTQYVGGLLSAGRGQWMVMLPGSLVCVPALACSR